MLNLLNLLNVLNFNKFNNFISFNNFNNFNNAKLFSDPVIPSVDWDIAPLLNPDGYEYTHTNKRLWRKNRFVTSLLESSYLSEQKKRHLLRLLVLYRTPRIIYTNTKIICLSPHFIYKNSLIRLLRSIRNLERPSTQ